ncbi:ECF-type sigma factor [Novosphingobium sp.]|uniref:ECF-type sigma factor n=1 Tax=Novosphingobium sp. TaxID=1874826 RepID=UPI003B51EB42
MIDAQRYHWATSLGIGRSGMITELDSEPIPADLLAACYTQMRQIARAVIARDAMARVFQPTELANEAAIRLIRSNLEGVTQTGHMLGLAARTMRQVLIGEARKTMAQKRQPITMMTAFPDADADHLVDIEALDRALVALATHSPDHAQIVELRFMLGLSLAEAAEVTGVSERTLARRWQAARLWLLDHIGTP